jgi:5-methylcytosine-specific restriction endonuclease McrA
VSFKYQPGKSPEKSTLKKQGFYHTPAWRRLRVVALQRDHYQCQHCLRRSVIRTATEVHHIKPLEEYPDLALDLDNLDSLCRSCHEDTKTRGAVVLPQGVRIIKA